MWKYNEKIQRQIELTYFRMFDVVEQNKKNLFLRKKKRSGTSCACTGSETSTSAEASMRGTGISGSGCIGRDPCLDFASGTFNCGGFSGFDAKATHFSGTFRLQLINMTFYFISRVEFHNVVPWTKNFLNGTKFLNWLIVSALEPCR